MKCTDFFNSIRKIMIRESRIEDIPEIIQVIHESVRSCIQDHQRNESEIQIWLEKTNQSSLLLGMLYNDSWVYLEQEQIAGFILVSGSSHTISTSTAGGRGFTAIIVAWLAKFNVWAMAVIAFLLVFMQQGAIQIATQYNLNENASEVITGIILFFVIGCEFFINYKLEFRKKHSA